MARDGSGTMSVPYPNFVAGTTIESSQVDANNTDLVNEITNSIAADGQTAPTANLPMGGFHLTGLASGTAATDSVHLRDVQYQAWSWAGTAGGTADALALSPSPAITAYAAGQAFRFIAGSSNTTAVTVAVSGLTTKAIQNNGNALVASEIVSGKMYEIIYDGTQFQLSHIYSFAIDDSDNLTVPGDVEIISTDTGATTGPVLDLYRNSDSPAASDSLGAVQFNGEDSAGNKETYAEILADIQSPTSADETGRLYFRTVRSGTFANRMVLRAGLSMAGTSGGDQGADTINATTLYEGGTSLASKYEAIDADILRADTGDTLTAGYLSDSYSGGTQSSGTYTPAPATGQENFQHITNGGAFTLAPPASPCTVVVEITNNGSAGAITTSGFTQVVGDSFTTTDTHVFVCYITKTNSKSVLSVVALQ